MGVKDETPLVVMTGFGDNSVNFEIGVWMDDPWEHRKATSELHEAVWSKFKDLDIAIAFPQLDVHLDERVVAALAGRTSTK